MTPHPETRAALVARLKEAADTYRMRANDAMSSRDGGTDEWNDAAALAELAIAALTDAPVPPATPERLFCPDCKGGSLPWPLEIGSIGRLCPNCGREFSYAEVDVIRSQQVAPATVGETARAVVYTCGCRYFGDLASASCPGHPSHVIVAPVLNVQDELVAACKDALGTITHHPDWTAELGRWPVAQTIEKLQAAIARALADAPSSTDGTVVIRRSLACPVDAPNSCATADACLAANRCLKVTDAPVPPATPLELDGTNPIAESAYCHHRHHLDEHSTDFDTCPHHICANARRMVAPAPAGETALRITAIREALARYDREVESANGAYGDARGVTYQRQVPDRVYDGKYQPMRFFGSMDDLRWFAALSAPLPSLPAKLRKNYEDVANNLKDWINTAPLPPTALHDVYSAHVLLCALIESSAPALPTLPAETAPRCECGHAWEAHTGHTVRRDIPEREQHDTHCACCYICGAYRPTTATLPDQPSGDGTAVVK